jgi:DNA-binding beta-propeller fold protein YncE
VLKYDLTTEQVIGTSAVGSQTRTIALSHDERVLYAVSNEDGKIVALRADDLTHLFDAPFTAPMGVAISPDDQRVWVTSYTGAGYVSVYDVVIDGEAPPQSQAEAPEAQPAG